VVQRESQAEQGAVYRSGLRQTRIKGSGEAQNNAGRHARNHSCSAAGVEVDYST